MTASLRSAACLRRLPAQKSDPQLP